MYGRKWISNCIFQAGFLSKENLYYPNLLEFVRSLAPFKEIKTTEFHW